MTQARLSRTPGAEDALVFASDAYRTHLRRAGRTVEHPRAVAQLLADADQAPDVVVAGVLHDVLEDTDVTPAELRDRFGANVARIVEALTQDAGIAEYARRKAALRRQTIEAGPEAASVALADKTAKLLVAERRPKKRRLVHYRATLVGIEQRHGRSSLADRLREQLARWPSP